MSDLFGSFDAPNSRGSGHRHAAEEFSKGLCNVRTVGASAWLVGRLLLVELVACGHVRTSDEQPDRARAPAIIPPYRPIEHWHDGFRRAFRCNCDERAGLFERTGASRRRDPRQGRAPQNRRKSAVARKASGNRACARCMSASPRVNAQASGISARTAQVTHPAMGDPFHTCTDRGAHDPAFARALLDEAIRLRVDEREVARAILQLLRRARGHLPDGLER